MKFFIQRYSRETPFTALNVDVRNHHTLIDSLEQYVKGDLLEGANAYHCERCDKKVRIVYMLYSSLAFISILLISDI